MQRWFTIISAMTLKVRQPQISFVCKMEEIEMIQVHSWAEVYHMYGHVKYTSGFL